MEKEASKLSLFFFMLLGVLFIGWSFVKITHQIVLINKSVKTEATVVNINYNNGRCVIYSYKDSLNKVYEKAAVSSLRDLSLNDRIEIIYNPIRPTDAVVNRFGPLWLGSIILLIVGSGFLGISFFGLKKEKVWMVRKIEKEEKPRVFRI